MFQLLEFRSCLLQADFSGQEGRADVDKVVICDDLIIYINSLGSWGFAQILGLSCYTLNSIYIQW